MERSSRLPASVRCITRVSDAAEFFQQKAKFKIMKRYFESKMGPKRMPRTEWKIRKSITQNRKERDKTYGADRLSQKHMKKTPNITKQACFIQTLVKEWGSESNHVWFIIPQHAVCHCWQLQHLYIFEWQPPIFAISLTFKNYPPLGENLHYSYRTNLNNRPRHLVFWRFTEKEDNAVLKFPSRGKILEVLDHMVVNTYSVLQKIYICKWE